jgi:hypothetical protein
MSAEQVYTVFMFVGVVVVIGLGYATWVITRKEKQ